MATQATWGFAQDQRRAAIVGARTQDTENHSATNLIVSDDILPDWKIYIYNILPIEHVRNLPPNFPAVLIPACLVGEKYAFTTMPPAVRNRFNRVGTTDYYYQMEDGRKSAGQLLNPASFPGIVWDRQLVPNNAKLELEQSGSNLNDFGVWWSTTRPQDEEKLEKEIELFKARVLRTMRRLVNIANSIAVDPKKMAAIGISPRMHFAMDYLKLQAPWHTSLQAKINCPTCGEEVLQGIAYHKNSMGERCFVDLEKCQALGIAPPKEIVGNVQVPPVLVSTEPMEVQEIEPTEEVLQAEDDILAAAAKIRERRYAEAAEKRKATMAAKKAGVPQTKPSAETKIMSPTQAASLLSQQGPEDEDPEK